MFLEISLTAPQDTVAPHSYFCWSAAIMIVTNTSSSAPLVLTINTNASAACSPGGGLVYFTSTLADTRRLSPYLQWRHMGRPAQPSPQQVSLAWARRLAQCLVFELVPSGRPSAGPALPSGSSLSFYFLFVWEM